MATTMLERRFPVMVMVMMMMMMMMTMAVAMAVAVVLVRRIMLTLQGLSRMRKRRTECSRALLRFACQRGIAILSRRQ